MRSDDSENWSSYSQYVQSVKDDCCKFFFGSFAITDRRINDIIEFNYRSVVDDFVSNSKNDRTHNKLLFLDYLLERLSKMGVDDCLTELIKLNDGLNKPELWVDEDKGAIGIVSEKLIDAFYTFKDFFELEFSIDKFEYYTIFFRFSEVQEIIQKHLNDLHYDQDRVTDLYVIKSKISRLKQEPFTLFKHPIHSIEDINGIVRGDGNEFLFIKSHISVYESWIQSKIDFYTSKLIVNCSKQELSMGIQYLIGTNELFDIVDFTSFINHEFEILSDDGIKRNRLNDYVLKIGSGQMAKSIVVFFALLHDYKIIVNSKKKTLSWILKVFGKYKGFTKHTVAHYLKRKSVIEAYSQAETNRVKRIFNK